MEGMTGPDRPAAEAPVSDHDRELILGAATDYIESWLDGDAERMARCLHPDLVKRSVDLTDDGSVVDTMSRDDMVDATRTGRGRRYERPYDVDLFDAYGDIATVRVWSSVYMDYLHVGRFGDTWRIVNVLWQRRPGR